MAHASDDHEKRNMIRVHCDFNEAEMLVHGDSYTALRSPSHLILIYTVVAAS